MAAAPGNQYAAKSKQWQAAIERALDRMGDPDIDPDKLERTPRMKALDDMAAEFLSQVKASGMGGFKELGDRLDGKPVQQTELSGPNGGPVEAVGRIELVGLSANSKG
jgi:hypothetical protein